MMMKQSETGQLTWLKSSHSGAEGGECIEVAATPCAVHVRDSKNPTMGTLTFTSEEWADFVDFARRSHR